MIDRLLHALVQSGNAAADDVLLEALPGQGEWRILVEPDHRTTLRTRAHAYGMVPFALAGTGVAAAGQAAYDEVVAEKGSLVFEKGHELMRHFLG